MTLCADGVAGEQIEHGNFCGLACHGGFGIFANQYASLVVVGGEQGIGTLKGAVQRDHLHALALQFLDCGTDRVTARRDQDRFGASSRHIFKGCDLSSGIPVRLTRCSQQLGTEFFCLCFRAHFHFYEKWVGLGLGD